ncbi:cysteinyl-tRNA synthetase [Streptomyces sp. WM6386]|nr:cysteinyl-tRNA synthetase [Streptomyces sp. WM6386]
MPAHDPDPAYAHPVLHIIDARTGAPVPARRGPTRVEAHVPGYDGTALRVLLVADVLARALEIGGTPVWSLLSAERDRAELRAGAAALGVRPFEDGRDSGPGTGGSQVVHVAGEGGATPDGVRVAVAPVTGAPEGADPGVLRLALLSSRHGLPVRLDAAALSEADDTLVRWRRAVAAWAREPSKPVPEDVRGELRTAWEDDLDVPGVLRVLRRVEASDLPAGARFETYAYADRLLGLELTRDLGTLA